VTWHTTAEVEWFLDAARALLEDDPVANNALLTEAVFWSRLSDREPGARFGWWADSRTGAAWVHLPDHVVLLSPLPSRTVADLPRALAGATGLGVRADDVPAVTAAWQAAGSALTPVARFTILRLGDLHCPAVPEGASRHATAADLPVLRNWFELFRRRHPEDPSHVAFVVDQPLAAGGIVVWEVGGRPVAMASRTPLVAGLVRMGLAFQPSEGRSYADAAFLAGCADAQRTAAHVLVISGDPDDTARYRSVGFEPAGERVVLRVSPA
jgi:hypothetical protein